jgi:hypothetical protein
MFHRGVTKRQSFCLFSVMNDSCQLENSVFELLILTMFTGATHFIAHYSDFQCAKSAKRYIIKYNERVSNSSVKCVKASCHLSHKEVHFFLSRRAFRSETIRLDYQTQFVTKFITIRPFVNQHIIIGVVSLCAVIDQNWRPFFSYSSPPIEH